MPLNEFEFPASKLAKVQSQLQHLVGKNYYLHQSAREAYRGCALDAACTAGLRVPRCCCCCCCAT